ncbi:MAG: DUF2164 domain-containing protein [Candidatus Eisenbacteria bacterium]
MPIELGKDVERRLLASIKRYCAEVMEQDVGDLKASFFLEFCLEEIGPCVYNQAIADAQAFLSAKVQDLDASCFQEEFAYWRKKEQRDHASGRPSGARSGRQATRGERSGPA